MEHRVSMYQLLRSSRSAFTLNVNQKKYYGAALPASLGCFFFFSRSSQAQTQEWTQPRYNHDFIWQITRDGHNKSLTEQDQIVELPQKKAVDR